MAEIIVFVSIVCGGLLGWFAMTRMKPLRYRRRPVLTGSEREFFYRLQRALPECRVCPQVAVAALIEPTGIGRLRRTALNSIDGKRVGFAIFAEDMQLLAVVELDQRSRPTRDDLARDACFASAGIRTVRFHAKRVPSEGKIRSSIFVRQPRTSSHSLASSTTPRGNDIEFRKTPWRNTIAHI